MMILSVYSMNVKAEELKDENQYRQETFYAMDEEGNMTEIEAGPALVEENNAAVYLYYDLFVFTWNE